MHLWCGGGIGMLGGVSEVSGLILGVAGRSAALLMLLGSKPLDVLLMGATGLLALFRGWEVSELVNMSSTPSIDASSGHKAQVLSKYTSRSMLTLHCFGQ